MISANLFKKAAIFADIHFGMNVKDHNETCFEYIKWFITTAKEQGCETCIFLGDFHHHRARLDVPTMNYSMDAVTLLSEAFDHVHFIVGNHDLFYRQSRKLNSLPYAGLFENVTVYSDPVTVGDVTFLPWLVNEEWQDVNKMSSKYMMAHLEMPRFKMNSVTVMEDRGEIQESHVANFDHVFTGHFHKRQTRGNITYLGSPFAHNYADVWDDDRGMGVLEWGKEIEYFNFTLGPRFITIGMGHLLTDPKRYLNCRTRARVTIDTDMTYEETSFIKKMFSLNMDVLELTILSDTGTDAEQSFDGDIEYQSISDIVVSQLKNVESATFDSDVLINMYEALEND